MEHHIIKNEEQELESVPSPVQKDMPLGPKQKNLEPSLRRSRPQNDQVSGPQLAPDRLITRYKIGQTNPLTIHQQAGPEHSSLIVDLIGGHENNITLQ